MQLAAGNLGKFSYKSQQNIPCGTGKMPVEGFNAVIVIN